MPICRNSNFALQPVHCCYVLLGSATCLCNESKTISQRECAECAECAERAEGRFKATRFSLSQTSFAKSSSNFTSEGRGGNERECMRKHKMNLFPYRIRFFQLHEDTVHLESLG